MHDVNKFFRLYIVHTMGREPKTGWTRTTMRFEDALAERIRLILPYEGAGDLTAFVNLACTRLLSQVEQERPIPAAHLRSKRKPR